MEDTKRNEYLAENEKFLNDLNEGLCNLNIFSSILSNEFQINISQKPWYKNIIEIYVPQAINFYENCKKYDFSILEDGEMWMRSSFKSFVSEIEKFIKFIIKIILDIKSRNLNSGIKNLNKITEIYKNIFSSPDDLKKEISMIAFNLNFWNNVQNKNKHEEEHLDSSWYNDLNKRTVYDIGSDALEYLSLAIYRIICPLLLISIIILRNKSDSINNEEPLN